jgi:hypothetical protein
MNLKEEIEKARTNDMYVDHVERIAEAYAKERAKAFSEWCNQKGWLFRKGIGNWMCFHEDRIITTQELYAEFEAEYAAHTEELTKTK